MRRYCLLAVIAFVFVTDATAQKKKTFKIQPGERLINVIPGEEKYSYADFKDGNVYFRQNTYSAAKMNYNALYGEMQFIDPKGDTLSISDETTIRSIVIAADTFFYDKGYLKQIKNYGEVKLASKTYFSFVNRQKIGGFGEVSSASIDTYNAISGSNYFKELVAKEILTIAKNNIYYVGDKFNNFKIANKKNLVEVYAKKEKEIHSYLDQHKVDFSNEDDIKNLLNFITSSN